MRQSHEPLGRPGMMAAMWLQLGLVRLLFGAAMASLDPPSLILARILDTIPAGGTRRYKIFDYAVSSGTSKLMTFTI